MNPASVVLPALPTRSFAVGSGSTFITGANLFLAPGTRGNATMQNGHITFSAGTYNFASLDVEPRIRLTFDTSAGPLKGF